MVSRRIPWVVSFACLILYAYVVTSIGPVLPRFSIEFNLTPDLTGVLVGMGSIGGLMAILGGWVSDRVDRALIGAISIGTMALGSFILGLALNAYAVVFSLFLINAAAVFLESSLNPLVSDLYPERRGFSISLFHVGWNIGSSLGPSLAALVIILTESWRTVYLLPLPALIFLSISLGRLRNRASRKSTRGAPSYDTFSTFTRSIPKFLPLGAVAFFYAAVEMGINAWLAFILEDLGSTLLEAGLATGLFWALMGIGRLVWGPVIDRIGYGKTIISASSVTLPCMIAASLELPFYIKVALWIISGFLLAPIFPTLIAWGTSMDPDAGGTISGLILTMGALGLFSSTSIVGFAVRSIGARAAQYVFVVFTSAILIGAVICAHYVKKKLGYRNSL